jgi:hypothetical protein
MLDTNYQVEKRRTIFSFCIRSIFKIYFFTNLHRNIVNASQRYSNVFSYFQLSVFLLASFSYLYCVLLMSGLFFRRGLVLFAQPCCDTILLRFFTMLEFSFVCNKIWMKNSKRKKSILSRCE